MDTVERGNTFPLSMPEIPNTFPLSMPEIPNTFPLSMPEIPNTFGISTELIAELRYKVIKVIENRSFVDFLNDKLPIYQIYHILDYIKISYSKNELFAFLFEFISYYKLTPTSNTIRKNEYKRLIIKTVNKLINQYLIYNNINLNILYYCIQNIYIPPLSTGTHSSSQCQRFHKRKDN
jgi:hypothetical protein